MCHLCVHGVSLRWPIKWAIWYAGFAKEEKKVFFHTSGSIYKQKQLTIKNQLKFVLVCHFECFPDESLHVFIAKIQVFFFHDSSYLKNSFGLENDPFIVLPSFFTVWKIIYLVTDRVGLKLSTLHYTLFYKTYYFWAGAEHSLKLFDDVNLKMFFSF